MPPGGPGGLGHPAASHAFVNANNNWTRDIIPDHIDLIFIKATPKSIFEGGIRQTKEGFKLLRSTKIIGTESSHKCCGFAGRIKLHVC
jgi:hypothetical protein